MNMMFLAELPFPQEMPDNGSIAKFFFWIVVAIMLFGASVPAWRWLAPRLAPRLERQGDLKERIDKLEDLLEKRRKEQSAKSTDALGKVHRRLDSVEQAIGKLSGLEQAMNHLTTRVDDLISVLLKQSLKKSE